MLRRFVVIAISTLAVCAAADNPPVKVIEEIAAKVNGDIITRGELEKKRSDAEAEAKRQGLSGARLQDAVKEYSANALRDEIDQLLLVQKAKDLNINVDADVTRRLAEIQVQNKKPDPDQFQAFIREQTGMPFEDFKDRMRRDILTQRVIGEEVMRGIVIPQPELQKYYEDHKKEFVREEQVFLSQILISTEGKSAEQVAAAEKKAKDLVARAKKGDKFADLARDNSDDTETAKNGGYIGAMKRGLMDKQIEEVVFKGKKGDVTDPIKRPQGFLILKVEEHFNAGQASFEEVKNEIQDRLVQPKAEPKVREFLSRLREDAFLQIKEGYVDSGAVPGKDTRWQDMAQLKPQTTTKEEVAARRKKHILWVIPAGTVNDTKTKDQKAAPTSTPAAAPAAEPAKAADPAKPADAKPAGGDHQP
jgi:parvulin-like peptidyl-prolyl isomerase